MNNSDPAFTPEGTLGPFYPGVFAFSEMPQKLNEIAPILAHRPAGQPIRVFGRFVDANGVGVPSLIIEIWQANAYGRYRHPLDQSNRTLDPQFDGFARIRTSDDGSYSFSTIKPGAHPVREGSTNMRAPHLRFTIFASGIDRLVTQVFFDDETLNSADPVLNCIEDPGVRRRLIARRVSEGEYALDIVMRGEAETPFFDDWAR
jgi:protocatechuate 3,4-dioxygenase alpha subunit